MSSLATQNRQSEKAVVLELVGRIDSVTAATLEADLKAALEQASSEKLGLVVDLTSLDFITSVGLRALMVIARAAKKENVVMGLAAPNDVVREILTIARFTHVVPVHMTLDDAYGAI